MGKISYSYHTTISIGSLLIKILPQTFSSMCTIMELFSILNIGELYSD